jgi:hypothetical protein
MKANHPLKKHHFWILCGVAPLLTLLGVSCVSSGVGAKIAARQAEIDTAKKDIASRTDPKPEALLKKADDAFNTVSKKQGNLHEINWTRQKPLYTWPAGFRFRGEFERADMRFGDRLPTNEGQFDELRKAEVYLYEFSSRKDGATGPGTGMADTIAPTQFYNGSWRNVLRHVNDFGQAQLTNDQVWLMMEDIWVQRSLLDAVRSINTEMSTFRRAKIDPKGEFVDDKTYDDKGNKIALDALGNPIVETTREGSRYKLAPTPDEEKRKAVFKNRVWGVELELIREGGGQRLIGTLTNLSERLQLMGVGNVMTLNVRFSKDKNQPPLVFKIGGEFLPGKGSTKRDASGRDVPANVLPVVRIDDHIVPPAMNAEEIVSVEQVFDIRTVPIKRIEALALGFLDARNAGKPLLPPGEPFTQEPVIDPNAGMGMGMGMGEGGRPGFGPMGPMGPMGFGPGGVGGTAVRMGGGPLAAVIDGNKKRYLEITKQVRRLPVGIVVVVDQAYMEDMLLAFANSPLRFQITQVNWTRFRGTLSGIGPGSGSGGPGEGVSFSGPGQVNIPNPFESSEGSTGRPPVRPGPGPMGFPPMGFPPMGPMGFPPMGPGPMGSMGSGPGYPGMGYPGMGGPATVSEAQITSSLVELSIYGIVSLYEKYEVAPKAPDAKDATPPMGGMPMGGMPMGGMPAMPMDPSTPKMRRRRA